MSAGFYVYCVLFVVALIGIEAFVRGFRVKKDVEGEAVRKLVHVVSTVALALAPAFMGGHEIVIYCFLAAGFLMLVRTLGILKSTHTVKRLSWGEICLPIGVLASVYAFLPENVAAYQAALLTLGFADTAAAIVGRRWGTITLSPFGTKKTLEGFVAFWAVSLAIITLFVGWTGPYGVLAAFAIASIELFSPYGLDNIGIPLVTGYLVIALS